MIPEPPPVDTGESTDANPNLEAVQSALRFPLFVTLLGIIIASYGEFVANEEWVMMTGATLVALGFFAWILLKLLYGGEISHKQK